MSKIRAFLACCLLVCMSGSVGAAVIYNEWRGTAGTTDWNTPTNWNHGYVPKITLGADNIRAGFKGDRAVWPVITEDTIPAPEAYNISLGGGGGGTVTINGGTLTVGEYIYMGVSEHENGTFYINGGTVVTGTVSPGNAHLMIGQRGVALVEMTGGTVDLTDNGATGELRIAHTATATARLYLDGGVIYANNLVMNFATQGDLDLGGGTLVLNGDKQSAVGGLVAGGLIVAYGGEGTVQIDYDSSNPGKTTVRGHLPMPKAAYPSPTNNANHISITPALSWTPGDDAVSHDVYFGTVSPGAFQGNQAGTTFAPGTLEYGTTYYWRIDERTADDVVTTGDVWSFTTLTGQAITPYPENGSVHVTVYPELSWTAAIGATSRDVYFGVISPGDFQGNQVATTFDPGTLTPNTTYYWRVDEYVDGAPITGTVWSFTTGQLDAYNPSPLNGADEVVLNMSLTWTAGAGAVSHDVYFGTTSPGDFQGNQAGTIFDPGVLEEHTTYYWRIDERDGLGGVTVGNVWSFTTGASPEVYPYVTWRGDSATSIVVNWWNPIAQGDSSVDYGLTDEYGSTVHINEISHFHHVELTDLTPSTTYHYRIRSSDGTVGQDNTFTTAAENPTSFSFMVFGDPRGNGGSYENNAIYHERHRVLIDWMVEQNPDFVLQLGDIVWAGAILHSDPATKVEIEDYWMTFFEIEKDLSKSTVIMTTMGNHEVQPGGRDYIYYYDLYEDAHPNNGPVGSRGRVYSYTYGNAHFVCLTSYQINMAQQAAWLEADLAAARENPDIKWIFAFMHAPTYTTDVQRPDRVDQIQNWSPLFEKYGVNIVFAGHNHFYERSHSLVDGQVVQHGKGPIYITSGLGGASFNTGSEDPKFATWFTGQTAVVRITIDGDYLLAEAVPNATGVPLDVFQLTPPFLDGDLNESGSVGIDDLGIMSEHWLETGLWP